MIERINSLDDPRLDCYARLTEVQLRNRLEPERGIFIAESEKVIDRALAAGYQPLSMLVPEHKLEPMAGLIERVETAFMSEHDSIHAAATSAAAAANLARPDEPKEIPIFVAPAEEIEQLAGYELTRGVLCAMRRKPLPSVEEVLAGARRVAVLEDITNHTNVGAAFRSAAALNIDAVLVTPACCDPLYRRAVRVSMGTVFQVPWTRIGETAGEAWPEGGIAKLHELGFKTAAMALSDDSVSLDDPALKEFEKLAIIMGTEGDGLAENTIAACDYTVRIPMAHGVDSLNVAAASAVAFWELRVK